MAKVQSPKLGEILTLWPKGAEGRLWVGSIGVARLPGRPGKLWLTNEHGEGMETSEAKLGAVLEKYFKREF